MDTETDYKLTDYYTGNDNLYSKVKNNINIYIINVLLLF